MLYLCRLLSTFLPYQFDIGGGGGGLSGPRSEFDLGYLKLAIFAQALSNFCNMVGFSRRSGSSLTCPLPFVKDEVGAT